MIDLFFDYQKMQFWFLNFGKERSLIPRLYETPLYKRGIKYPVLAGHPFIKWEIKYPVLAGHPFIKGE